MPVLVGQVLAATLSDFDSKEDLITAVLTEARRRESALLAGYTAAGDVPPADLIRAIWLWASAPDRSKFLRLFFELYVQALSGPAEYADRARAMVTDWLGPLSSVLSADSALADPASATLLIAVLRGLLLDQLNTGDVARTTQALEHFLTLAGSGER